MGELVDNAVIIRDETQAGANTAARVGGSLVAIATAVEANQAKESADGSIGTHSDVDLTGISNGQILKWNSANSRFEPGTDQTSSGGGGGAANLAELGDVGSAPVTNGFALVADGSAYNGRVLNGDDIDDSTSTNKFVTQAEKDAIAANSAKVGITTQQSDDITANNAKVGITPGQAAEITANTAKVGITTQQAADIAANTAKVGYQDSLVDTYISGNVVKSNKHPLVIVAGSVNWTGLESNLYSLVLTEDSVLENPSTPVADAFYQFAISQDGTGLWTLGFGSNFKFPDGTPPSISLDPNSKSVLTAYYDGTDFLCNALINFL